MAETEAETIAELAVAAGGKPLILTTCEGREYLLTPEGVEIADVTEPNKVAPILPEFIKQAVTLQTLQSLVDYANRFKGETSVLMADIASNKIVAVIDYHGPDKPQHVAHAAAMVLPFAEEWSIWTGVSGKLQQQLEFARFIEENGGDIIEPSGADVLEAMRDLQARRSVNFTKAVRTDSENESFEYSDETNLSQKGGVEVPNRFKLSIPVYFGEAPTEVYAFLRWKLDDGHLNLGVKVNRAEYIRQAVFKQIVLQAAEQTGLLAMFGKLG